MPIRNLLLAIVLFIFVVLSFGCGKVKFSPSEEAPASTSDAIALESVFSRYLKEEVNREYMVAWLFSDVENFRSKIFDIKSEIRERNLSAAEKDRTFALEYELNISIDQFNNQNSAVRAYEILAVIVDRAASDTEASTSISPASIHQEGAPALAISDNNWGIANSVLKNGFKLEKVHFLNLY